MSDGIFAYVREESGRVGIIDYIRRIAMMSEENKTYDYIIRDGYVQ